MASPIARNLGACLRGAVPLAYMRQSCRKITPRNLTRDGEESRLRRSKRADDPRVATRRAMRMLPKNICGLCRTAGGADHTLASGQMHGPHGAGHERRR